jgi:hypothetical protein
LPVLPIGILLGDFVASDLAVQRRIGEGADVGDSKRTGRREADLGLENLGQPARRECDDANE